MGKSPTQPPPLGKGPKIGFENPRFPTIGNFEPKGNYVSQISTQAPIDPAQQARVQDVKNPFQSFGTSSGDLSRSAFSRALTDTSKNALGRATNEFNTQYQQQAEKSRAEDILSQRQNTFDRNKMNVFKDIFDEDTATHYDTEVKDLNAYFEREKKNAQAEMAAAWLRMLGGLI